MIVGCTSQRKKYVPGAGIAKTTSSTTFGPSKIVPIEPDATAERYAELRTTVFEQIQDRLRPINQRLSAFAAERSEPA